VSGGRVAKEETTIPKRRREARSQTAKEQCLGEMAVYKKNGKEGAKHSSLITAEWKLAPGE